MTIGAQHGLFWTIEISSRTRFKPGSSVGWSGGAMVLGKLPVPGGGGVLLIGVRVGQRPTALAEGASEGCLDIFSLVYHFSFLSPSLWETARYRLKYCLKGPLSLKQPTNQPTNQQTNQPTIQLFCVKGKHLPRRYKSKTVQVLDVPMAVSSTFNLSSNS